MPEVGRGLILSRRGLLAFVAGGVAVERARAAASDFWNRKKPAEWSSEEIDRLLTNSPWARQVSAEMRVPDRGEPRSGGSGDPSGYPGGSGGSRGGGMGGPNIGGLGIPRIGIPGAGGPRMGGGGRGGGMGGGRGGGRGTGRPQVKGTVRWESAQPILDATKSPVPESLAGHYVISVSGFPLGNLRGRRSETGSEDGTSETTDDMLERVKGLTSLEPAGRRGAQCGVAEFRPGVGGGSILFGFSKEFLDFGPADKEAVFSTDLGRVSIKTKFDLKAMRYQGALAV